jgi:hypothetical protein
VVLTLTGRYLTDRRRWWRWAELGKEVVEAVDDEEGINEFFYVGYRGEKAKVMAIMPKPRIWMVCVRACP